MGRGQSKVGPYGSDFETVHSVSNIKFIKAVGNTNATPMWTNTKGRVYAVIDKNTNDVKAITYYDTKGDRMKQIDLDRPHKGMSPHTHHGFLHAENDSEKGAANLTPKEKKMVERIKNEWYNYLNK